MNQKIAIIGAGLFGVTIYLMLKKNGFTLDIKKEESLSETNLANIFARKKYL